jgi:hypothetical protein
MTPVTTSPPTTTRGSVAIRIGVALLGTVGFTLSYDALRQMAVAIHVRSLLTYLFPLVIDGFIAIGVCALIILRTAPLHSRLYVWTLVGIATATSIWANALHAIRLNQQTRHTGLHLGDVTVGALSATAPLALAGSVHLYLVISRHPHANTQPEQPTSGRAERIPNDQPAHEPATELPDPQRAAQRNRPNSTTDTAQVTAPPNRRASAQTTGRPAGAPMADLLPIARKAVTEHGKVTRSIVLNAIRDAGLPISGKRLTALTQQLRDEHAQAPQPSPALSE